MRGFIVMCLVACAVAAPQYNYQPANQGFQSSNVHYSGNSGFGGSGGNFNLGGHGGGAARQSFNFGGGQLAGNNLGFSSGGSAGFSSFGSQGGSFGSGAAFGSSQYQGHGHEAPIVTKQFYLHSAPEEEADDGIQKTVSLGPAQKNYRVVFIKAPHASAKSSSVNFVQNKDEEKTVIYVLSKKTDAADIQTHVDAAHTEPSKPEVFFIKYRTPEEAEHAQTQIQAQYDSLGGTSQVSNEGVAPITSVVGALGGGDGSHGSGSGSGFSTSGSSGFSTSGSSGFSTSGSSGIGKSAYLPPN